VLRRPLIDSLATRFDARWLMALAAHGYDHGVLAPSNLAFFPLYPFAARLLGALVPGGIPVAGVIIAWAGGLACAWGLFAVGRFVDTARTGVMLAMVWAALPHAVTESMAYTEAPFTALAVWAMFALLTRRWIAAGVLAMLSGLTRPTGLAVIGVVALALVIELVKSRGRVARLWIALVLAPLGWVAYYAWVAVRTGSPLGWLAVQRGWGSTWDFGAFTAREFVLLLGHPEFQLTVVSVVVAVALLLLVVSIDQGQPWQLILYSTAVFALALGEAGYYQSKARFLIPAFALLLPIARALARTTTTTRYAVLGFLALASAYYGVYLLAYATASP
jgi:hypothetical protein